MNSSSSSSSSSSSWLSFGSKTQTLGCISLFLQRFLCSCTSSSSSSSTYTSDQITEFDSVPPGDTEIHKRVSSCLEYVELQDDNFFIFSFENDNRHEKRRNRETEKSRQLQMQSECKENNKNAVNALLGHETLEIGELKLRRKEKRKKRRKRRENVQKEPEMSKSLQTKNEYEENNKNASNALSITISGRETLEIVELKLRRKEKRKKRSKRRENIRKETEKSQPIQTHNESKDKNKNASNASPGRETLIVVSPKKRQNITEKFTSKELSIEKENREEEEEECGSCQDLSPVSVLDFEKTSRRRLSEAIEEDHMRITSSRWSEYNEMWLMICRITDSEIKESNWVNGKASKAEDLEENISEDIVSHILDQLLEETITNTLLIHTLVVFQCY